jgi:hypothetical protein
MKFFCHITIVDDETFARVTFTVMRASEYTFVLNSVENDITWGRASFPPLTLANYDNEWEYSFKNGDQWLTEGVIFQLVNKLNHKLVVIKK